MTFFRECGSCLRSFFCRGPNKIGELLIINECSIEQAIMISYFTSTGVLKQVLLFALIIFYLRSAKCLFHSLSHSVVFFNTIVICPSLNFQLSSCCFSTHLIHRNLGVFEAFL